MTQCQHDRLATVERFAMGWAQRVVLWRGGQRSNRHTGQFVGVIAQHGIGVSIGIGNDAGIVDPHERAPLLGG